jgi:hypothetical protein
MPIPPPAGICGVAALDFLFFDRFFRSSTAAVTAISTPRLRSIKEIAEIRMRYGYRRVHVVLLREGWMTNIKRT